jgi:hypothetical protein
VPPTPSTTSIPYPRCNSGDGRPAGPARPGLVGAQRVDTGLGHFPSHYDKVDQTRLDPSMTGCILLYWLRLLALDGDLAVAPPKTLRYRVLHAASTSRPSRTPPDQHKPVPVEQGTNPRGPWNSRPRARQLGHRQTPGLTSRSETGRPARQRQTSIPVKDQDSVCHDYRRFRLRRFALIGLLRRNYR